MDNPGIRIFTKDSMVSQVLERLGLVNAWENAGDYGFSDGSVEALATVEDATLLYVVQPDDDPITKRVADDPGLVGAPVRQGRSHAFAGRRRVDVRWPPEPRAAGGPRRREPRRLTAIGAGARRVGQVPEGLRLAVGDPPAVGLLIGLVALNILQGAIDLTPARVIDGDRGSDRGHVRALHPGAAPAARGGRTARGWRSGRCRGADAERHAQPARLART